jgi:hypothetical protein
MILFVNTFITDQRLYTQTVKVTEFNNFDILKHQLASYSNMYPWKRVIIKVELDENYLSYQEDLDNFIQTNFGNYDLIYKKKRNNTQDDWIKDYELLNDDVIWFNCNHDHPYIDTDKNYLYKVIDYMKENPINTSLRFSHWPEALCLSFMGNGLEITENVAISFSNWIDSIQVITKDIYFEWWCRHKLPNLIWPRPDYFPTNIKNFIPHPTYKCIIPFREICRHFDGYMEVSIKTPFDICKPLSVPDDLFRENIVDIDEIQKILKYHENNINTELLSKIKTFYNLN